MSVGKDFLKGTRYSEMGLSLQKQGLPQPPLELPYDANAKLIQLPPVSDIQKPARDLFEVINQRRTGRHYTQQPLSLQELALLLWATQGVQEVHPKHTMRTVPSAGARHAFETYLLINNVEGIEAGLYRYLALENALLPMAGAEKNELITSACHDQKQVSSSAVTFIWAAVTARMFWRYDERGYRYLHLDAGHVCQNLYLAAEALDSRVCAIAAFDDDELNLAVGLDGEEQWVVYVASLGKIA